MAFRKKANAILKCDPDVLIVPECEHPDKLRFSEETKKPDSLLWFGDNPHKGLGIFAYNGYRLRTYRWYNNKFKYVIPLCLSFQDVRYNLYAVWANNPTDPDGRYVEQVWKAIHHYQKKLVHPRTLLAGDFNSNTIWDRPKREANHTEVVLRLEEMGIHSTYHHFQRVQQGKEIHPTLYLYRHEDKPYHIDYCFASADLVAKLLQVTVGAFGDWCGLSDHVPVIAEFANKL